MLGLDIAYMHAKFDHSSFSRSEDIAGSHQNLNGSCDLTTPFQGWFAIRGLALAMINLSTKFEVCLYPLRRYERRYKILNMGWFGVVRGHSRSLEIASFNRAHSAVAYEILLVFMSYLAPFLRCWSKIANLKLPLSGAPIGGDAVGISQRFLTSEN